MSFFFSQVGLLNVDGYYNALLSFIDKAVEEGFILPAARHIIVSAPTAKELFEKLEVKPIEVTFNPKHIQISFWRRTNFGLIFGSQATE